MKRYENDTLYCIHMLYIIKFKEGAIYEQEVISA